MARRQIDYARCGKVRGTELVFSHQDMRLLGSQQGNNPEDISSYHQFEADRAIALDWPSQAGDRLCARARPG
jgi:hypothetical protein